MVPIGDMTRTLQISLHLRCLLRDGKLGWHSQGIWGQSGAKQNDCARIREGDKLLPGTRDARDCAALRGIRFTFEAGDGRG
jgi:hypothetical protein